jgi:hypothetical protein
MAKTIRPDGPLDSAQDWGLLTRIVALELRHVANVRWHRLLAATSPVLIPLLGTVRAYAIEIVWNDDAWDRLYFGENLHDATRQRGVVNEVERARNRVKSKVRSRVEHVIGLIKLKSGFTKVRYLGLEKNANRLFATCGLTNLYIL